MWQSLKNQHSFYILWKKTTQYLKKMRKLKESSPFEFLDWTNSQTHKKIFLLNILINLKFLILLNLFLAFLWGMIIILPSLCMISFLILKIRRYIDFCCLWMLNICILFLSLPNRLFLKFFILFTLFNKILLIRIPNVIYNYNFMLFLILIYFNYFFNFTYLIN